jgi:aspartate carbamoyltransferase regulatory subunit
MSHHLRNHVSLLGHVDHEVFPRIRKQIACHNAACSEASNTKNPYNTSLYICISDRWESMLQCHTCSRPGHTIVYEYTRPDFSDIWITWI